MIPIFGTASHLDIHRFSTILYTSGISFLVIGFAQANLNTICLWKKKEIIPQIKITGPRNKSTSFASHNESVQVTAYHSCVYTRTISNTIKTHNKRGNDIKRKTLLIEFSQIEL